MIVLEVRWGIVFIFLRLGFNVSIDWIVLFLQEAVNVPCILIKLRLFKFMLGVCAMFDANMLSLGTLATEANSAKSRRRLCSGLFIVV